VKVIENDNCVFFDCDDTLVMWDNKYKTEENQMAFSCYEAIHMLVPHWKHINHLIDLKEQGKTIVVWSAGGWEWAQEVVTTLRIEDYVDAVMAKPTAYVDDLHCSEWMGVLHYQEFRK
jgi:FMN phosphatase YigB (HAD superfamily)